MPDLSLTGPSLDSSFDFGLGFVENLLRIAEFAEVVVSRIGHFA